MLWNLDYLSIREYVVLSIAYSCIAAVFVELLLKFWRIVKPEVRISFRLMILFFPPVLALLFPLARRSAGATLAGISFPLLDTQTVVNTVNLHLGFLWYLGLLVSVASALHLTVQVILPLFRHNHECIADREIDQLTNHPLDSASPPSMRDPTGSERSQAYPSGRMRAPLPRDGDSLGKLLRAYRATSLATGLSPGLVLTSDPGPSAEVRGAFCPSVIVSDALVNLLDEEELQSVLAHEFAHVSHAHVALSWITTALRLTMFYNPLAAIVHTLIALDVERVCDDVAVLSMRRPLSLAAALIKIHRACSGRKSSHSAARSTALLAIKIDSWEHHALHAFTVERVERIMRDSSTRAVHFDRLRQVMATGALMGILLFVT